LTAATHPQNIIATMVLRDWASKQSINEDQQPPACDTLCQTFNSTPLKKTVDTQVACMVDSNQNEPETMEKRCC
jgi:hypothetical protein